MCLNPIYVHATLSTKGGIIMEYILSKFSHELRNPLTTVYSTIQLIEMQHPEVKEYKYWSNLSEDLEYMNALLSQLSDYAKSETLQLETFSLEDLLKQISLSFAASIATSKVEYTSKITPSLSQITGDKIKLQEVFLNLLKNAFDAASPDKTIFLEATSDKDFITITIHDTGCGIPKEQLPTIFEPFVTYKKNGSGLGLTICHNIIKSHGGTITVDSIENAKYIFNNMIDNIKQL